MDFWLGGRQLRQDPAETEGILAERGSHPIITGGGGVALIKDEVDHFQHRCETGGALGLGWDLKWDVGFGKGPFGAHDALGDGWRRGEEGARDFFGGQATK